MTLADAARAVRENAYVPYSQFKVGAALQTASGAVHVGCNVENVAYPEGTCAEAGAIAAMVAAGETEIRAVYVIADSPQPVPPLWRLPAKADGICSARDAGHACHRWWR